LFFDPHHEVPPSLALFFLFKTLLKDFTIVFLPFSNAARISLLVLLTLVYMDCSFMEKTNIEKSLPWSRLTNMCPSCRPYSPWHICTIDPIRCTNYWS
jgi:hypothetical protein